MKYKVTFTFKAIFIVLLIIGIAWGATTPALGQAPTQAISVRCSSGQVEVEFDGWLPEEALAAFVDGAEVGQFTSKTDGSGTYKFQSGAMNVALRRVSSGETVLVGQADCSQPPLELSEVTPSNINTPVGSTVTFSAMALDAAGNEVSANPIWIAEAGEIDATGVFTATTEGDFLIIASLIGKNMSYSHIINATVTPPIASLEISPAEVSMFVGQGQPFVVMGTDDSGNEIAVDPSWDFDGGEMQRGNFFVAETPGDYTFTAYIPGIDISATVTVHVSPPLDRIGIAPEIDELLGGDSQQFEVVGYDPDGNEVEVTAPPIWAAEIGVIDSNGMYVATTEGAETITAIVDLNVIGNKRGGVGVLAQLRQTITATIDFPVISPPIIVKTEEVKPTTEDDSQATKEPLVPPTAGDQPLPVTPSCLGGLLPLILFPLGIVVFRLGSAHHLAFKSRCLSLWRSFWDLLCGDK